MTLNELEALKARRDQGVLISREQWYDVLLWAIEVTKHHEGQKDSTADEEGWIPHVSNEQPVPNNARVDVFTREDEYEGYEQDIRYADEWIWTIDGDLGDILKYRIVK